MSAHIMTALQGYGPDAPGTRNVRARFRGPSLVAPETGYDTGGSVIDMTTKPAAAAPVSDAASTSQMLYNGIGVVKVEPVVPGAFRLEHALGAGASPALSRVIVKAPAITATVVPFDFNDLSAAALTNQLTLIAAINPGTRVIGAEVEIVTPFGGGAVATLTFDIGEPIVDANGIVDSGDLLAAIAGTVDNTPGVLSVAGMWQPAVAGTIELEATSTVANLDALTAGEAIARVWTVDNDSLADSDLWDEVAAGTDLTALTFTVSVEGL